MAVRYSPLLLAVLPVLVACGESAPASADADVVTKKCPERINASFRNFERYSLAQIAEEAGGISTEDRETLEEPLKRLEEDTYDYNAALVLEKAERAVCTYRAATPDAKVSARFYTSQGKNVLRVDALDGAERDFSFYTTVKSYAKDSLTIAYPSAAIFYRDHTADGGFRPWNVGRATTALANAGPLAPAVPLTDDALEAALKEAVAGAMYMSETDTELDVFRAPIAPNEKVDAKTVKRKFNGMPNTDYEGEALKDMAGEREGKFSQWFGDTLVVDPDPDRIEDEKYPAAMRAVHVLMASALKDLKVVYVSSSSLEDSMDVGWVQIFIVGRSASGTLFAVHTGAAWT